MIGVPSTDGALPCSEPALALFSLVLLEQAEAVYADCGKAKPVEPHYLDQAVNEFLAYVDQLEKAVASDDVPTPVLDLESLKRRIAERMEDRSTPEAPDADQL